MMINTAPPPWVAMVTMMPTMVITTPGTSARTLGFVRVVFDAWAGGV
jgi:hypothetical protein